MIAFFPFSPLFLPALWWAEKHIRSRFEENSTRRVTLWMEHYRDKMSIYYFLSLCPSEKAQLICYCLMPISPLLFTFFRIQCECFKIWLLFASYSQVIIRISSAWDNAITFGMGNSYKCTRLKTQENLKYEIVVKWQKRWCVFFLN